MLADESHRARPITGGTDLLLEMARGLRPDIDTLIDLSRLPELQRIGLEDDELLIGAGITHNEVVTSPVLADRALPLVQASWEVASPQLRNRATVVGNVVTASPANDTITPLRALGCQVEIASQNGTRSVDLADFHLGVRRTVLAPDELVTGLRVRAMTESERGIFIKVGLRKAQAISVIHLCLIVAFDGPEVTSAAISLGSVAPVIVRASTAEQFLVGRQLDPETVIEAARMVSELPQPIDDIRATASYRTRQLEVMTRRGLESLNAPHPPWSVNRVTLGIRTSTPGTGLRLDPADRIEATVNGQTVAAQAASSMTLLDWLRDEIGLTGSKEGCGEGECGACTIYLDGVAVMSCLIPAGRAAGATIETIEGLGGRHVLQDAFLDQGAVQCGYCIPGFIMSGAKLLGERPRPTRGDISVGFSGNLCRCTGYYPIAAAVEQVGR